MAHEFAFYLLIALHSFQLTLLANAEIQEILPLVLQGFLVSLWWDREHLSGFQLVLPPPPLVLISSEAPEIRGRAETKLCPGPA